MSPSDLGVVFVTWNSAAHLERFLSSIAGATKHAGITVNVVQIDNASSDTSVAISRGSVDHLVCNSFNVGFAQAVNQGASIVESEWLAVLNPDLILRPDFFAHLRTYMSEASPETGVLSPELRFLHDPGVIQTRGIGVDSLGIPFDIDAGKLVSALPETPLFGASGGALVIRRHCFLTVGGFTTDYFAYLEDVDLAWKLQLAHVQARYAPLAAALHAVSSSTGQRSVRRAFLVARNRRLLFARYGRYAPGPAIARDCLDLGHMAVETVRLRSLAPLRGRVAGRRLAAVARDTNHDLPGIGAAGQLPLCRARSPLEHLIRKRAVLAHTAP